MSYERKGGAAWAIHPGEILKEEFLKPMELSFQLAWEITESIGARVLLMPG